MKYLFYLLPGLLNVVMGLFFFITAKRMADAGASSLAVTATMPVWALIYAVSSFIIGKYATRSNAVKILIISQVILLCSMLGLLFSPAENMQYVWLFCSGLGTGLFFAPFQTVVKLFEKVEISSDTFARSSAVYTFSWSFGQGIGPMTAALIWGLFDPVNGWRYCYMVNIAIVCAVIVTLFFMQIFIKRKLQTIQMTTAENTSVQLSSMDDQNTKKLPDVMKAAWILALGGFLAIAVLRSYLPDYATKILHLPTSSQGIMLALISIVQAFVALSCVRTRIWPFKPYVGMLSGLCAAAAMLILGCCTSAAAAWTAAALFGLFSGVFCFNITFHALANAEHSAHYASVNETIVGGTAVLAPLGAGAIADISSPQMPFYLLIAILTVCVGIFCRQTWQYRKL